MDGGIGDIYRKVVRSYRHARTEMPQKGSFQQRQSKTSVVGRLRRSYRNMWNLRRGNTSRVLLGQGLIVGAPYIVAAY